MILLLLLLVLQPTVGFSLLSDFLPFRPFLTQLSPTSYSHYLYIILYLSTSSAITFILPACTRVHTFQVPNPITISISLFRNLNRFREGSPVSVTLNPSQNFTFNGAEYLCYDYTYLLTYSMEQSPS